MLTSTVVYDLDIDGYTRLRGEHRLAFDAWLNSEGLEASSIVRVRVVERIEVPDVEREDEIGVMLDEIKAALFAQIDLGPGLWADCTELVHDDEGNIVLTMGPGSSTAWPFGPAREPETRVVFYRIETLPPALAKSRLVFGFDPAGFAQGGVIRSGEAVVIGEGLLPARKTLLGTMAARQAKA